MTVLKDNGTSLRQGNGSIPKGSGRDAAPSMGTGSPPELIRPSFMIIFPLDTNWYWIFMKGSIKKDLEQI